MEKEFAPQIAQHYDKEKREDQRSYAAHEPYKGFMFYDDDPLAFFIPEKKVL